MASDELPAGPGNSGSAPAGHRLEVEDRERTIITGVRNVETFDDGEIVLDTELGMLTIRGEGLHIQQLDLDDGLFEVEGLVASLVYTMDHPRVDEDRGLLDRLLR